MSIKTVRAEIREALQAPRYTDKQITKLEAREIMATADIGPVTRGELRELQRLVDLGTPTEGVHTLAMPELRGDQFYLDGDARTELVTFIALSGGYRPGNLTLAFPETPGDTAN